MPTAGSLHAPAALLPNGWATNVRIEWDDDGLITGVTPDTQAKESAAGPVLPGMPNVHSHAFQRGLVGRTQSNPAADDDFWSWRSAMYEFVERLTPERVEALATNVYAEMLRHGYTSVAEFHYLHHDRFGSPYDDPAEMSLRVVSAAESAGIGLTLLPVLYRHGGFDRRAAGPAQRRFTHTPDAFAALIQRLRSAVGDAHQLGLAPHSLRAVGPDEVAIIVDLAAEMGPATPIHIHVSEQTAEVNECIRATGARPVAWLLDHAPVDSSWCLVHATHVDPAEISAIERSGATVGLCPTTEADLGDGVFPFEAMLTAGGRFAIGSDSQVSVSPGEELRLLLYGHRLTHRRRALRGSDPEGSVATSLWQSACNSAAAVLGMPVGRIEPGFRADLLVLRNDRPLFADLTPDEAATAFILSGGPSELDRVLVRGRAVVVSGRRINATSSSIG